MSAAFCTPPGHPTILFAAAPRVTLVSQPYCRHDTSEIVSSCVNAPARLAPGVCFWQVSQKFRVITRPHVFVMGRGSFNQVGLETGDLALKCQLNLSAFLLPCQSVFFWACPEWRWSRTIVASMPQVYGCFQSRIRRGNGLDGVELLNVCSCVTDDALFRGTTNSQLPFSVVKA